MSLTDLLQKNLLGDKPHAQIEDFLYAHMPVFTAPTDAAAWRRKIPKLRREALARVYLRGFPAKLVNAKPRVVWGGTLRPDPSYLIRKLRYEIYPDFWIPALLYEPTRLASAKAPVVLNPNGHGRGGKAAGYKQARCANLARRGMLALSIEFIGMSELEADWRHNNIAHLDVTGLAGVGFFYLALKKGLDVLLSHRRADPTRVCVTGVSGGGWQTIVAAALDPRVTVAVPVAGYTALRARVGCVNDMGDMEQTPVDMTTAADYDTLTAMLAPRPALVIYNENDDCCFKTERARPVIYDAVKPTYTAFGVPDHFQTYSNTDPGTHNYLADNRSQLYKFLNKHFHMPPSTPGHDIHTDGDLLTEDTLRVGLPSTQTNFLRIASDRACALAHKLKSPKTAAQKRQLRKKLRDSLKLPSYDTHAQSIETAGDAENLLLNMGPWSLPATWAVGEKNEPAVLVMNDPGRAVPMPLPILPTGPRCFTEMVGTGETGDSPPRMMIVNASGQRLLGVQAAQVLASAHYAAKRAGGGKVHAIADGYNSSFVMLVAAALEPTLFISLTTYLPVTTLRYLSDWPLRYEEAQSLFHPGLLEIADVPQLRALMEGVEYRQPGRDVPPDRR